MTVKTATAVEESATVQALRRLIRELHEAAKGKDQQATT